MQQQIANADSDPTLVRTRRATTVSNKWLAAPNCPSGNDADCDQPLLSTEEPPPNDDKCTLDASRQRSFDRKSLSTHTKSLSREEPDYVAVMLKQETDAGTCPVLDTKVLEGGDRRRIRTILRQQSSEVPGYKFAYKLSRRDALLNKRRLLASCSLCFAMLGLGLIVLENELMVQELTSVWLTHADLSNCRSSTHANLTDLYMEAILAYKASWPSQLLKLLSTVSTACLLVGVVADRIILLEMFKINNSIGDWHLVLSPRWLLKLCLELVLCAVQPLPFCTSNVIIKWDVLATPKNPEPFRFTPLDVFLTLPMLCRLYLIFRVIVAYSRHTAKASSHSISALNRINVDARFILKTTAIVYPGTLLLGFIAVFWITASWCMRLCEW